MGIFLGKREPLKFLSKGMTVHEYFGQIHLALFNVYWRRDVGQVDWLRSHLNCLMEKKLKHNTYEGIVPIKSSLNLIKPLGLK